jgi:hypothetical protein
VHAQKDCLQADRPEMSVPACTPEAYGVADVPLRPHPAGKMAYVPRQIDNAAAHNGGRQLCQ